MNKHVSCAIALLAVATAGPTAEATGSGASPDVCRPDNPGRCLNGVTTSVTNGAGLRVTGADYADIARERSGRETTEKRTTALGAPGAGLAAGDEPASPWGLWTSYSRSNYDSDFRFNNQPLGYDASADNVLVGADALLAGRFLVGAAFGYQNVETESDFNGGSQESDGYTIAPYAAWLISDHFSIDVSGGYSPLDYDQRRISPTDGTSTTAGFDSDRWFAATNLNVLFLAGDWVFGGKIGYLHTEEEQDGYTETGSAASAAGGTLRTVRDREVELSQIVVGGDVAYHFGALEPYLLLIYRNDVNRDDGEEAGGLPGAFTRVQPDDDDEVQIGFGFRFYTDMGLSGSLEYAVVEGRDDFDNRSLLLTVRGSF